MIWSREYVGYFNFEVINELADGECLVRLLDFINTVDGANVFLEEGEPGIGDGFFRRELPTLPFECLVRFFLIFNHMYFVYNSYIGSAAASSCNQC